MIALAPSENQEREKAVPMSRSQRQVLKAFIMNKEEEVLDHTVEGGARQEILETGAIDCLYGLHALYQKLLEHEVACAVSTTASDFDYGDIRTLSATGWKRAFMQPVASDVADSKRMDAEEATIARILFDAADLDANHSIPFNEFAMLAVLLSATDSRDADAQVCEYLTAFFK
jgi:hypothetical protein